MGVVRIWMIMMGVLLVLAPGAAAAEAPVLGMAGPEAADPDDGILPQDSAGPADGAGPDDGTGPDDGADPGYGAGDSLYDTAEHYDAVAWPEPDAAGSTEPDAAGSTGPAQAGCRAGTVALTFDDGPGPYTPQVLDVLARNRVRATFFVVGQRVPAGQRTIRRIVAGGHRVQNHTWSHPNLVNLSTARVRTELARASSAVTAAGAPRPTQVRPPYGAINARVAQVMRAQGLTPIRWTIDTNDWRGPSATQIRGTVRKRLQPGAVVLMHDGLPSARTMLRALPGIVADARAAGYCFGFPRSRTSVP